MPSPQDDDMPPRVREPLEGDEQGTPFFNLTARPLETIYDEQTSARRPRTTPFGGLPDLASCSASLSRSAWRSGAAPPSC